MADSDLTFDDALLVVIDELATPDPGELVGHVFLNQDELDAFLRLSAALNALLAVIGERGTYEDAVRSGPPWQESLAAAEALRSCLSE